VSIVSAVLLAGTAVLILVGLRQVPPIGVEPVDRQ